MNFEQLHGFGMINDVNTSNYYVTDPEGSKIYMFDDNWDYINYKTYFKPVYILTINETVYITGIFNIYKADKNLNIIKQYNAPGSPYYNGIYHNETNSLLYIVSNNDFSIDVFDLDLMILDSILISPSLYSNPYSIQGYNNSIYVGTYGGLILVIINKTVVKTFNGCFNSCSLNIITSILFDQYGYMITTTDSSFNNNVYLYKLSSFIGTFSSFSYLCDVKLDSKGRLIFISFKQIYIYY
jgi:hypothetical protein